MSEATYEEWQADQEFIGHAVLVRPMFVPSTLSYATTDSVQVKQLLFARVWWLNPPEIRSTRVSIGLPLLSDDKTKMEQRNLVAGWRCDLCRRTLFAVDRDGLRHAPCCGEDV